MADIRSTAAEIRRGKKRRKKERRRRKETTGQKYNGPLLHRAAIIIIINDNVYGAVLMTMVTAGVHPVHLMNAD